MKVKQRHGRTGAKVRRPNLDQLKAQKRAQDKLDALKSEAFDNGWAAGYNEGYSKAHLEAETFLRELSNSTNISSVRNKIAKRNA